MGSTKDEIGLSKGTLNNFWLDSLSNHMEKHYPDVIGYMVLVDHWKIDGWNDGTTTLYGVYESDNGGYFLCSFPDYGEPQKKTVTPQYEHVGWQ